MNYSDLAWIKGGVVVGTLIASIVLTAVILPEILRVARELRLFDIPNERKIHTDPIPRLAGLSFMPVMVIVMGLSGVARLMFVSDTVLSENLRQQTITYIVFAMGLTLLYLAGAADDLVGVSYKKKALVQLIAAALLPLGGFWINDFGGLFGIGEIGALIGVPLTIIVTVFIINAINLIDGLDGLAASLTGIGLITLSAICFNRAHFSIGILAVATIGMLIVFLKYNLLNRPPRKLFMGDAGSMCLGYIAALLVLHFWNTRPDWDPQASNLHIVSIVALAIPLLDVLHVFVMRVIRGRNPFLPDKTHIHHRLLACGLSPRAVLGVLCGAAAVLIVANVAAAEHISATVLFLSNVALWIVGNICLYKLKR